MQKFKIFIDKIQRYYPEIIFVFILFIIDQISKILAVKYLLPIDSVTLLPFFKLTYVENTGAAFGLLRNGNLILIICTILILFFMFKWRKDILVFGNTARIGFLLIIAGALGNLYDRIMLGYVVDYFDFIVWPVFNIADSLICVGAGLLVYVVLKDYYKKRSLKK